MQLIILKSGPHNQFHLGKNTLETTHQWIHSDTLFSAIINTCQKIFPKNTDDLVSSFENGKVRLSSAFHCLTSSNGQSVYFLPKPIPYHYNNTANYKETKKIEFFSLDVWKDQPQAEELNNYLKFGKTHLIKEEEVNKLGITGSSEHLSKLLGQLTPVAEVTYPKVRVNSRSQLGVFYHQVNIQLQQYQLNKHKVQTHFYFLLDHELEQADEKKLMACLRLLSDEGIGGERSSGCGQLRGIEIKDAREAGFPALNPDGMQCSLSLTVPADENEFKTFNQYRLIVRGGGSIGKYGNVEKHRKQLRMIEEGALFQGEVKGKLVDIHPEDHGPRITRNGIVFSLPYEI